MNRIVLIGNQICSDFCPVLRERLKGEAELWTPSESVDTSVELLAGVPDWVLKRQPEIAVFASGLLDTRRICFGENERLIPLTAYARNVRCTLKIALERSAATPVWLTIPPVDSRRGPAEDEFGYDNETIALYNEEAKAVARMLGVAIIDLYGIVKAASRLDSNRPDGVRFDERGSDFIAGAVAERLSEMCKAI